MGMDARFVPASLSLSLSLSAPPLLFSISFSLAQSIILSALALGACLLTNKPAKGCK